MPSSFLEHFLVQSLFQNDSLRLQQTHEFFINSNINKFEIVKDTVFNCPQCKSRINVNNSILIYSWKTRTDPRPAPQVTTFLIFMTFANLGEKYPSGRKTPTPMWICDLFLIDLLGCRGGLFNFSLRSRKDLPTQLNIHRCVWNTSV